ncbi:hypothetical protein [Bradyrhizobium yuanmingense]|uniref:hypothetical protein n=1 Tax=Bradyrhizobium yuanmingense TaxID=108015 RepID=UPI000A7141AA|nr:hypothetical protein [Bradyrhizobium yuanmingense]
MNNEVWEEIVKSRALGLDHLDQDRAEIERAIDLYKRRRTATKEERRLVEQTRDSAAKTLLLLTQLLKCEAYFVLAVPPGGSSDPDVNILIEAGEAMGRLEEEMEKALDRFNHVRDSLFLPELGPLEELAFDLISIHAVSLDRAPPTSGGQTAHNPGFETLVHLCATSADSTLTRKQIDRAIASATSSLHKVKLMDPTAWNKQWNRK